MPNIGVIIKKMVHRSYKGVFVMSMITRHLLIITVVSCMIGGHKCLSFARGQKTTSRVASLLPSLPGFQRCSQASHQVLYPVRRVSDHRAVFIVLLMIR